MDIDTLKNVNKFYVAEKIGLLTMINGFNLDENRESHLVTKKRY